MRKRRFIYFSARCAGILALLAAVLHAVFGTAGMLTGIKVGDIRSSMVLPVKNVYLFSSVLFLLSAVWILFLAAELRAMRRRAWWQALLLSLGYIGGSLAAIQLNGLQIQLVGLAFIGLILLFPLLIFAGSFTNKTVAGMEHFRQEK